MATKEELINGLEMTLAQAKRLASIFADDDWGRKRAAGWTPKEIYCHVAAVAGIVPQMAAGLMSAPEDGDFGAGLDIDQMNAQAVGSMSSLTPEQVLQALETNYDKLIEFVKAFPDEQLKARRRLLGNTIQVSDVVANAVMLHGLHHLYEASSPYNAPE
jgi:hypothetical protein